MISPSLDELSFLSLEMNLILFHNFFASVFHLDSISHRQDGESIGFPNSPPIGESSKREHVEEDEDDETVENDLEEQFKDSLEFDKFEVPGIKNITVKKAGSGSPIQAKPPAVNEPKGENSWLLAE